MEYQRIADELRRKAARLINAAESIEEVYLLGQAEAEDATEKAAPPQRWAPGRGAPEPSNLPKKKPAPPAPVAKGKKATPPAPAKRKPAPEPEDEEADTVEEVAASYTKKELRAMVDAAKQMMDMNVPQNVFRKTLVNWCAGKGIAAEDDLITEAIRLAKKEAAEAA